MFKYSNIQSLMTPPAYGNMENGPLTERSVHVLMRERARAALAFREHTRLTASPRLLAHLQAVIQV